MKRAILLIITVFLMLFTLINAEGIFEKEDNAIVTFTVNGSFISKEGLLLISIGYRIKDKVHIYTFSPIANDLAFEITSGELVKADFPEKIEKDNEIFLAEKGEFFLYIKDAQGEGNVKISYQGCSDAGLCYIPESRKVSYKAEISEDLPKELFQNDTNAEPESNDIRTEIPSERKDKKLEGLLRKHINNPLWAILLVFLAGILTSLTPCVYPMIPVTISYFGKTGEGGSVKGSFIASVFYVLGLAATYTSLGVLAGLTGSAFGSFTGNKFILLAFAVLFFFMAFMMCDYITLPGTALISSAGKRNKRSFFQPFILGLITGLVASPCVGPVVLFLLTIIISSGNIAYGALLMFFFSLGLGLIFIFIGTFSGALNKLPRAGMWMERVKVIFSILMVGVAVYFLQTALGSFIKAGAAEISIGIGIMFALFFLGFFDIDNWKNTSDISMKKRGLKIFLLFLVFLLGTALLIKGVIISSGYFSADRLEKSAVLKWHASLEEGKKAAKKEGKLIFLDFRADWCVMCREFENLTTHDKQLQDALNNFILVKLDYDKNAKLAKEKFKVMGLPTFLILDHNGKVLLRESGFLNLKEFRKDLLEKIGTVL